MSSVARAHTPAGPMPTIRVVFSVATSAAILLHRSLVATVGHFIDHSTKGITTYLSKQGEERLTTKRAGLAYHVQHTQAGSKDQGSG